jgi:hypothetical protein
MGQSITLEGERAERLVGKTAAELRDFEKDGVDRLFGKNGRYLVGSVTVHPDSPRASLVPRPQPGTVRFRSMEYPRGQTVLVVENGYPQALTYHLDLLVRKQRKRTTVCIVTPGKRTIEHWPYKVRAMEISDVHLSIWSQGQRPACG